MFDWSKVPRAELENLARLAAKWLEEDSLDEAYTAVMNAILRCKRAADQARAVCETMNRAAGVESERDELAAECERLRAELERAHGIIGQLQAGDMKLQLDEVEKLRAELAEARATCHTHPQYQGACAGCLFEQLRAQAKTPHEQAVLDAMKEVPLFELSLHGQGEKRTHWTPPAVAELARREAAK